MPQAHVSPAVPVWRQSPPGDGTVQVGFAGVLAGLALPVLYVAWLNRGGPGEVCDMRPEASACFDAWNPWLFLGAAGLLLVAAACILRAGLHARQAARTSGSEVLSWWFGAGWAAVGAIGCFGVLSLLTIGIFVLPVAVLLAYALARLPRRLPSP